MPIRPASLVVAVLDRYPEPDAEMSSVPPLLVKVPSLGNGPKVSITSVALNPPNRANWAESVPSSRSAFRLATLPAELTVRGD